MWNSNWWLDDQMQLGNNTRKPCNIPQLWLLGKFGATQPEKESPLLPACKSSSGRSSAALALRLMGRQLGALLGRARGSRAPLEPLDPLGPPRPLWASRGAGRRSLEVDLTRAGFLQASRGAKLKSGSCRLQKAQHLRAGDCLETGCLVDWALEELVLNEVLPSWQGSTCASKNALQRVDNGLRFFPSIRVSSLTFLKFHHLSNVCSSQHRES